jgi:hypothetical protein
MRTLIGVQVWIFRSESLTAEPLAPDNAQHSASTYMSYTDIAVFHTLDDGYQIRKTGSHFRLIFKLIFP